MYQHIFSGGAATTSPGSGSKPELGPMLLAVLQAFADRFEAFEDELRTQHRDGAGESDGFALKVHTLVEQLREIVPKMVQQEQVIKNIQIQLKNVPKTQISETLS